jgi:hypothetical protein
LNLLKDHNAPHHIKKCEETKNPLMHIFFLLARALQQLNCVFEMKKNQNYT